MKIKFTLITVLIAATFSYAQNGINYKALIKDDLGNVIENNSIQIKFQILESNALINVYEETHSQITDNYGIIIVDIGEGTIISGVFDDINWGGDEHFLNVKIDTGSGFVDMGTTEFSAVTYAFHAKKAANVSGLEAIEEGNGIGWRLIGRDADNYDNIGFNAIDLSFVDDPNLGLGATGSYAFSIGHNGTASGEHALTFGNQNYAVNDYAIALGNNNTVTGLNSIAIGGINQVSGDYAFSAGLQNEASQNYTVALGTSSTASGEYAIAMGQNATASGENSTAFGRNTEAVGEHSVALGSGAEAIGDFSFAFGDESEARGNNSIAMGDDSFATVDYAVAIGRDALASGVNSFALGYNTEASNSYTTAMGHQTTASGEYATAMGSSTTASSHFSTAMGHITRAIGDWSTSMGYNTEASGEVSTAIGANTNASGDGSTAIGSSTTASEFASTAMGRSTTASESYATAMGNNTIASGRGSTSMGGYTAASAFRSTALGSYNIGGGSPDTWVDADPIFEIGNGSFNTRNNALTVLKNGNVGIGTHTPQELLHISGGRLRIGTETIEDTGSDRLSFNASLLPDLDDVMNLGNSNFRWNAVWSVDGSINTSDRREKKNIKNLHYGLEAVLQMQAVSFNWKNKNNPDTKLGLIAQDIQELIPEVVKTHVWEKDEVSGELVKKELKRLGVYYSDLVPVLIKAIQEQHDIIESQELKLKQQDSKINGLTTNLNQLESITQRLNQLEINLKHIKL